MCKSAQLSRAPSAFISSKNAIYESSILCGFSADEEFAVSCFTTVGAAVGRVAAATDERDGFGFDFGIADSLLTRTDAGTCIQVKKKKDSDERTAKQFKYFKIIQ